MKEDLVFAREMDGKEQTCIDVLSGDKRQQLCIMFLGEEPSLVLQESSVCLRSWPLHTVRLQGDQQGCGVTIEVAGEVTKWYCGEEGRRQLERAMAGAAGRATGGDAALGALLEGAGAESEGEDEGEDAAARVRRLGSRLAQLDTANVAGLLAAAAAAPDPLAARLASAAHAAQGLAGRHSRARDALRPPGAPDAPIARPAAPDHNARKLLHELAEIFRVLDAPELRDLESISEVSLASAEGRSRWLSAWRAATICLRAERTCAPAWRRLGGIRERVRRIARARDALAAAVARHLNNLLIHLGNEATAASAPAGMLPADHHAQLLPYAPFMRHLRETDEKAYEALLKVYVSTWARVYERAVRAATDGARTQLAAAPDTLDQHLDAVLTLVETVCNAEQDFCTQFFHLDVDLKSDGSDGERSESGSGGAAAGARRSGSVGGAEARRLMSELFPALEQELVTLVQHLDAQHPYGAMRALACAGRRALGDGGGTAGGGGGEARWARAALAACAVAAKRAADRAVTDRIAALPDAVKQAARRPKCGVLSFVAELEAWGRACERVFAGGRRADLDRWYLALVSAMIQTIHAAEHPRTPRSLLQMENYHALGGAVAALRVPALESLRRECRTRYADALRAYVTHYFGRPLEKLNQFFEGVDEAVSAGAREEEVCFRAAFSKHELRRLLALYPAHEVRKSLHRLYRNVERQVSEEGGLLQVVWRAMQHDFLEQHTHLQNRIAACYPGAGLALPLSTQDILDAFSDIAQEH